MSRIGRGGFGANMLKKQNQIPNNEEENNALTGPGGDGVEQPTANTIENRSFPEDETASGQENQQETQAQLEALQIEEEGLRNEFQRTLEQQEKDQSSAQMEQRRRLLGLPSQMSREAFDLVSSNAALGEQQEELPENESKDESLQSFKIPRGPIRG